MSQFITTGGGKSINPDAIAFITTRRNPAAHKESRDQRGGTKVSYYRADLPRQLVIGFSAIGANAKGSLPLSIVLEREEAIDFLDQFAAVSGTNVAPIKEKLEREAPREG